MYRDSIKFIVTINEKNMPAELKKNWDALSELDRLMIIKDANRASLQRSIDYVNENNSWAKIEMADK